LDVANLQGYWEDKKMKNMSAVASVIIPAFNRVHLLAETLDSIIAQDYNHWECLVIDDGSTDGTQDLILQYEQRDPRIKFFERPLNRAKGANACRNIGLEKAQGECIIFFDSDDLMTPNHIGFKVQKLYESGADFIIAKTKNLGESSIQEQRYNFKDEEISAANFARIKVRWLTYDTCIKSSIAKSVSFNEHLKSGQEFNYFMKMLLVTNNGRLYDEYVTLRRLHDDSIQSAIVDDPHKKKRSVSTTYLTTYEDIRSIAPAEVRTSILLEMIEFLYPTDKALTAQCDWLGRLIKQDIGLMAFMYYKFAHLFKQSSNQRLKNRAFLAKEKVKQLVNAR
jgi:glycosyltransferase involved in cell wall biosynthesis